MENSKESQNKFLDALIINFLEKFKKYTSNLENNEDNNEFHTMIFILSYITSNNLIDTATLDKYLNGNQIYEVFKKKRNVLNELSKKYKDKIQEGGGFFDTLLKFIAVLSMFNSAVESHVVVDPEALTTSERIVDIRHTKKNIVFPFYQLPNPDGRCALIQALITNPPEEADQIITEFTNYYLEKKGFGWLPELINPKNTELEDGNILIERGFTEDFGSKEYVSIMGYDISTIMKYVLDTIKEIMDDVFSQPGYIEGQISMSAIGIPGHAETLLVRKHNGNTYYGILETNIIAYIGAFATKAYHSVPLYTVQPGFFTQEELESMKSNLYDNIVTETDTPIEDVSKQIPTNGDGLPTIQLEMPTKQNPAQAHIPALVIPHTTGERLIELGKLMAPIIEEAQAQAEAAIAISRKKQEDDDRISKQKEEEEREERRARLIKEQTEEDEKRIALNNQKMDAEDIISDLIRIFWGKWTKYEDNVYNENFATFDEDQKALEDCKNQIKIIEDKMNEYKSKNIDLDNFVKNISSINKLVDKNKIELVTRYKNIQPLKSANIQPLQSANIPLKSANIQSANRFSALDEDDVNDEITQNPQPIISAEKIYQNKEKKNRNAYNKRETKRNLKNFYENTEKYDKYNKFKALSRSKKKLFGPPVTENYVGNVINLKDNLKSGGKVFNKTRRKRNKSKTKRRNNSKTKRRNNSKTKRRNKTRRRK